MAWTAPMTAVANATFTAAQFNTYVRDNLNETAPAKATTAGSIFVATGANAIAERIIGSDSVSTSEGTASTSYTNLTTSGPAVTVTTGTAAIVIASATMSNNTAGSSAFTDFDVSGATTRASTDTTALAYESGAANDTMRASSASLVTLTAGSNTFTQKYKVNGGTGTFLRRHLIVVPL